MNVTEIWKKYFETQKKSTLPYNKALFEEK